MSTMSFRSLARMRREHPRGWTWMCAMLLGGMSLVIGLGVTVYDGVLNRTADWGAFFVLLGLFAFYIPGLLMAAAAVGMRRGWTRLVRLGALSAAVQAFMALGFSVGHFLATPFVINWLVWGLLWTAGDLYVAWRLWMALPWVEADAEAKPGFELHVVDAEVA